MVSKLIGTIPVAEVQTSETIQLPKEPTWSLGSVSLLLLAVFGGAHVALQIMLISLIEIGSAIYNTRIGAPVHLKLAWYLPPLLITSGLTAFGILWSQRSRLGAKALWNPKELIGVRPWLTIGLAFAASLAVAFIQVNYLPKTSNPVMDEIIAATINGANGILWIPFLGLTMYTLILAPITEEWIFRGILQPTLSNRWGSLVGVGITGLLFGLVHMEPALLLMYATYGIAWGMIVQRRRSITLSIVCHMLWNLMAVTTMFLPG